ncbi:MAG TPA: hypothetical protein VGO40_05195 [Longimicrobium sp.]|jgi:hypothetical protein|nr:hypothetical protein [Longimicrobium sp.]
MTNGLRQWLRDPERWLQLVTLVAGLAAFAIGLREYRQDQRWKRLEYFTGMLQSIEAEPEVRSALVMLEYNQPRVCAREEVAEGPRCFTATDSLLTAAMDGAMRNRVLAPEEQQVVYALDRLLTTLDRLDYLQTQGFVDEEVRYPTIAYWISLVGDRRNRAKPGPVRAKLCEYVRFFEYDGALRLVARYTAARDRVPQCTLPASSRS